MREADIRLQELKDKGIQPYSISRLDSINNCLYGAYRTYKLHDRGSNNIYAIMGGKIHETLEDITNGKATEDDLIKALKNELQDMEMLNIDFPKDRNGGDSIRAGWIADMTHFCNTYKASKKDNLTTEELFIYRTPKGRYLIGYIDLQKVSGDSIAIYDYKTSTMYSKADMKEHGRQLVLYQMGKEQEGYTVNSVAWIFLKYAEIKFKAKKTARSKAETEISKVVERRKIGTELASYVESKMLSNGYDKTDIEMYLMKFKKSNMFNVLPDDIASQFKMLPYVCKYEVTDEVKRECNEYIDNTIDMWEALGEDEENFTPRKFTRVNRFGKESNDIFFCTSLCGHFNKCPYIHDFLDQMQKETDEMEDLF